MEPVTEINYIARPIKTVEQYNEALDIINALIDSKVGTPELETLELVSLLVHDYEQREFPIGEIDPVDAIKYQMDELGITAAELAELVGGRSRLSELFNRKRPLSINQLKTLSSHLDIPADILLPLA